MHGQAWHGCLGSATAVLECSTAASWNPLWRDANWGPSCSQWARLRCRTRPVPGRWGCQGSNERTSAHGILLRLPPPQSATWPVHLSCHGAVLREVAQRHSDCHDGIPIALRDVARDLEELLDGLFALHRNSHQRQSDEVAAPSSMSTAWYCP